MLGALFSNISIYTQENEDNENEKEYLADNTLTIYPPTEIETITQNL